ncbi:MAG: peptidoglycan recognition protein family protein, partial [Acidimicrobiia bacterium]
MVETPFPLSHLGVRWAGPEDAVVDVRVAAGDGAFGPWKAMRHDHDLDDDSRGEEGPWLSELLRVEGATRVQTRAGAGARQVELVAIDTRRGPRPQVLSLGRPARAADPPPKESDGEKVEQPEVVTRAEWGADESMRRAAPKFGPISKLFVHHTVTAPSDTDPDPASTVRAIYAYHVQGNGWDDIGYNFLVDGQGKIYEGRWARTYDPGEIPTGEDTMGYGVVGAQVSGFNVGAVGIAVIGDYTNVEPSSKAMDAVERMLAWKADRHDIDPLGSDPYTPADGVPRTFPNIAGHRDAGQTACPGNQLYPMLPSVRKAVAKTVVLAHATTLGYWTTTADGRVLPYGKAQSYGSLAGLPLNSPVVGMAPTATGKGYWLLGGDGGVFSFGDAAFYGSTGGIKLNQPVVGMTPTPSGKGYWFVASDGGIFAYGDAGFFGSTGSLKLNQPIVGMAATPTGNGYWLVASDGGIFTFGDARFSGSTGGLKLNSPVRAMATDDDGTGYWLVAGDGGVFTFEVPYHGSIPGLNRTEGYPGAVALRATSTAAGYYIADAAGGVA